MFTVSTYRQARKERWGWGGGGGEKILGSAESCGNVK